jgi:hypothetical protein
VAAYARLVSESNSLFEFITSPDRPDPVRVLFTRSPAPYCNAQELIESVRNDRMLEVTSVAIDSNRHHPLMDSHQGRAYDRFRAVHDILGHARLRLGFDRDGEFAVWLVQERSYSPLARLALASELHGQHSVRWTTGEVATPKAVLLDTRLLRRSRLASAASTKGTAWDVYAGPGNPTRPTSHRSQPPARICA